MRERGGGGGGASRAELAWGGEREGGGGGGERSGRETKPPWPRSRAPLLLPRLMRRSWPAVNIFQPGRRKRRRGLPAAKENLQRPRRRGAEARPPLFF
jgi:hypothetical protein